ncbi:MAG: hypothetical protein MN733_16930 [Nitrososphaera sp.]|nr:hypothetical protein [Nitrososphaera sp.]
MKEEHKTIIEMRKKGLSVSAISREVGRTKATVSWVLSRKFDPVENKRISEENNLRSGREKHAQLMRSAKNYYDRRKEEAKAFWLSRIEAYNNQTFTAYVAGIYEGEGTKGRNSFSLSNSSPNLMLAFRRFLTDVLGLPVERITVALYVHSTMDPDRCKEYWKTQGLPPHHLYVKDTRAKKKPTDKWEGRYYGVCRIQALQPLGMLEALRSYARSIEENSRSAN